MKKSLIAAALASALLLSGCAGAVDVCGTTYQPYGLFSLDQANPKVHYHVSGWSIFWGVVLVETVIAPIYIFGWDLYQADGTNVGPGVSGVSACPA